MGVLHTVALCHGHDGVSLCECIDLSVCMCVTLCFIVCRSLHVLTSHLGVTLCTWLCVCV